VVSAKSENNKYFMYAVFVYIYNFIIIYGKVMFFSSLASNLYNLIIKMYLAFAFSILMSVTLLVWILCIFIYVFYDSAGES